MKRTADSHWQERIMPRIPDDMVTMGLWGMVSTRVQLFQCNFAGLIRTRKLSFKHFESIKQLYVHVIRFQTFFLRKQMPTYARWRSSWIFPAPAPYQDCYLPESDSLGLIRRRSFRQTPSALKVCRAYSSKPPQYFQLKNRNSFCE